MVGRRFVPIGVIPMFKQTTAALITAAVLGTQVLAGPAFAENQMNYSLFPAAQAAQLPRGTGTLGLNVGRAEQITSSGLTFDMLKVNGVRSGSAGERAGLRAGDEIIAVDGRVFPSVAVFANYVGSKQAGDTVSMDTIPSGGGPQQAQRISVTLGGAGEHPAQQGTAPAASTGLSTGTKVAIGVGAAALFGCYKLGCFSRHRQPVPVNPQ